MRFDPGFFYHKSVFLFGSRVVPGFLKVADSGFKESNKVFYVEVVCGREVE